MGPAAHLPVKPGDKVLDICAAPGGKSTELGAKLKGRGLLFSNDISNSRAKALLKNLELFGIPNICVTSETPEKLAGFLPEFFDAILIDAPCSGEGMFRKDDGMVKDWLEKGPAFYAPIQRQIVGEAVSMLSPGGYLLYSTCTFAKEEDEDVIQDLLAFSCCFCIFFRFTFFCCPVSSALFPHKGHKVSFTFNLMGEETDTAF